MRNDARLYDTYAVPQREAARRLLDFTLPVTPTRILEPGCGTGVYTGMLLKAFPDAHILGIDVAQDALAVAAAQYPLVEFLHADAEHYQIWEYDLITSNATFQWFTDLPGTLERMAGMLSPGGALTFSYFGPETYRELDAACNQVFGIAGLATSRRFTEKDALAEMLRANFSRWEMEEVTISQTFPTLKALLQSIRYTGTRGPHSAVCWTPNRFAQVEAAYRAQYGEIHAGFQVIFCKGQL